MDIQLIQIYLFVCQTYDTRSRTCFQRLSNNQKPIFTDQELITIWFFGHLNGFFNKQQIYHFIENYWFDWFPQLPAYQTFSKRLNLLEQSFQTIGAVLFESLHQSQTPEFDHLIDSFPVMLAAGGSGLFGKSRPRCGKCRLLFGKENLFSRCSSARYCRTPLCPIAQPITNLVTRSRRA
jgi:hypothetical protein